MNDQAYGPSRIHTATGDVTGTIIHHTQLQIATAHQWQNFEASTFRLFKGLKRRLHAFKFAHVALTEAGSGALRLLAPGAGAGPLWSY